jgi:hypothetical protein
LPPRLGQPDEVGVYRQVFEELLHAAARGGDGVRLIRAALAAIVDKPEGDV